jgi:hypothetical protein
MLAKTNRLMTRVEYAELLVGKALRFNHRSKNAKKIRQALLLSALTELQEEKVSNLTASPSPSG